MPMIAGLRRTTRRTARGTVRRTARHAAALAAAVAPAAVLAPAAHAAPAAAAVVVDVKLTGTGVTVHEKAADPVKVTSYTLGNVAYLRRDGRFAKQTGYQEITVAPKGRRAVAVPTTYVNDHDSVLLADLTANTGSKVQTVARPLIAKFAHWSRDGAKAVLTVQRKNGTSWDTVGFAVVDAAAKTARAVTVQGADRAARFRWGPGGTEVVTGHQGGTRFYGLDGGLRRTFAGTGAPAGGEDAFSPSGKDFLTWCPLTYTEPVCVRDRATGRLSARVNIRAQALLGWWDDRHLIAVVPSGGAYRAVVADLTGRSTRVLADIPAADWKAKVYLSYTRP
ncbi:hypothetical protein AB0D67_01555 [Streptosporangium sp. NPDC048047]|uniref:hypothetical protein n=1 Tax=unclassified Streptosporangium TaxID=2632669 RepID=UPI00341B33BD